MKFSTKMNKVAILKEIIFSNKLILEKISEYAKKLNKIYAKEKLVIISVLNGSVFFTTRLASLLKIDLEIDFIAVSSYNDNKKKSKTHFYKELKINIANKNVLIIEDIIDSGKTIGLVYEFLKKLNPKHIRLCSLIMSGKNRKTNNNNFTFSIDRLLTLNNDS